MTTSHEACLGRFVAIGGAEDKSFDLRVLGRVLALAPVYRPAVAVIATASQIPEIVLPYYQHAFRRLGARSVAAMDVRHRGHAADPANVALIEQADVIFLTGGDQLRLTHVLGGTPLLKALRTRHAEGGIVAGTSAGAAAMSRTMIYDGDAAASLHKGNVKMTSGLGFVAGVVIDSHFVQRGRFARLMETGAANPERLGVGLGEDTGVIVHPGTVLETFGTGHVIVVDSRSIQHSNVADISDGQAIAASNMILHGLVDGQGYDVPARKVLQADALAARLAELAPAVTPQADAGAWASVRSRPLSA